MIFFRISHCSLWMSQANQLDNQSVLMYHWDGRCNHSLNAEPSPSPFCFSIIHAVQCARNQAEDEADMYIEGNDFSRNPMLSATDTIRL